MPILSSFISRPPTFRHPVRSTTPCRIRARLLVPPPMSMWSTGLEVSTDSSTAPAPLAARMLSKSGPAVVTTNSPANSARARAAAAAFSFRLVSPVMISAPVSTCSGRMPAARYSCRKSSFKASPSTSVSRISGVKCTLLR